MIFIASFVLIGYSILILYFNAGIDKLTFEENKTCDAKNNFSILVPFRNEAKHLPQLLNSLAQQQYPKNLWELILINDGSSDESVPIVKTFKQEHPDMNITLIDNEDQSISPKKAAIKKGISYASRAWIITTDADCLVPTTWLRTFDKRIQTQDLYMVVAPVGYINGDGFLHNFQVLDFLSLQGTTMGSFGMKNKGLFPPFLCNGANLCYRKEVFINVNGYEGNEHIASGDDVFLLEKFISKYPDKVEFAKSKEVIVRTSPKFSWKDLIQQRIRWSAKTTAFKAVYPKLIGLTVFLANLVLIAIIFSGVAGQMPWGLVGLLFLIKFNIDFVFLNKSARFFDDQNAMKSYFLSSLIHPVYTILIVILSLKKSYSWKGRKLK